MLFQNEYIIKIQRKSFKTFSLKNTHTISTSIQPALIGIFTIEYQRQVMELKNDCPSQLQFNLQENNLQAGQLICPCVFSKAIHILLQNPVHYWRDSLQSQWQKVRQVQF